MLDVTIVTLPTEETMELKNVVVMGSPVQAVHEPERQRFAFAGQFTTNEIEQLRAGTNLLFDTMVQQVIQGQKAQEASNKTVDDALDAIRYGLDALSNILRSND